MAKQIDGDMGKGKGRMEEPNRKAGKKAGMSDGHCLQHATH